MTLPLVPASTSSGRGATIECRDLVKVFDGIQAVDGVSASFEPGRIKALIGPNGAGKTTLFHLMAGSLHPDAGQVLYQGQRIEDRPSWQRARMGIGRLFQDVRVFGSMTVEENLLVAFPTPGEDPLTPVFRRTAQQTAETSRRREAHELLRFVGLEALAATHADLLSFGQQKLVAITRLLAAGATTLLLDEPTAGIDPEMLQRLTGRLRALAAAGYTIVLIEHNMNVVMELADWVYFLDEGQIVAVGLADEVLGDPTVRALYLGL
jgi:ABC-type branched-subunit amino acid transport system ATPase component